VAHVAVGFEELPWVSGIPDDLLSKRQKARLPKTYRAAVPARIAGVSFEFDADVLAAAEDAVAAIVRLDEYVARAFGGRSVAPLASVLLRSESASSSQIEHLTVSARQLAVAEIGLRASANAEMVAGNVAAMNAAIALAERLDADSILAMHEALLTRALGKRAGQWRDVQVWVGRSSLSPAGADFVPPSPARVPGAMVDLVSFIGRDDLPVLAHAAVAHAQFETIHPFVDGNGRTGRALLHAMLRAAGAMRNITVPLSAGLLADTRGYAAALAAYQGGDATPIVAALSEASLRATVLGRWLMDELAALADGWLSAIRPRSGSAAESLLWQVVGQGALTTAYVCDLLGVSETAARRALDTLTAAGVLTLASDKKRNRVWLAPDVLAVLDEFSARAGRRVP
jgi:Fic family protein